MTIDPPISEFESSASHWSTGVALWIKVIVVFVCALALLVVYADRVGWEGDDLAQIEGCVNFAHKGPSGVYRYYWQPLTYECARLALVVVDDPDILFLLPQVLGAACIAVLVLVVHGYSRGRVPVLVGVAFVMVLPEVAISGLYYNSTVFGLLPFLVALSLVIWPTPPEGTATSPRRARFVVAGAAGAAACLFRFDFFLCQPLVLYLAIVGQGRHSIRGAMSYVSGFGGLLLLATVAGVFRPGELMAVRRLHAEHVATWGAAEPAAVAAKAFTITSLLVWIVLLVVAVKWLAAIVNRRRWKNLIVLLPVAVALYPLSGLTSPKYLVPAMVFIPLVLADTAVAVRQRYGDRTFRLWSLAAITLAVGVQLVSFEPRRSFPFVAVTATPTFVGTADGPRALGAYMEGYRLFGSPPEGRPSTLKFSFALARAASCADADVDVLYLDHPKNWTSDDWRWAWPALHLQRMGYSVRKYDLNREIVLTGPEHAVRLRRVDKREYASELSRVTTATIMVPFIAHDDPHRTRKLLRATEVLNLSACGP